MPYKVLVDDNFHYMDASERYELGEFETWEAAIAVSRRIVDEFLRTAYRPGMSAEELYDQYTGFGEDPFIVSTPPANDPCRFSAWTYAKERCAELCQIGVANSGEPNLSLFEPLIIVISKEEVQSGDTSSTLSILQKLIESPAAARSYREKVDIAFHGYDDYRAELFEIPEVRNYVYKLDRQFPFWLYFLSKHHLGLQALLLCFLPPYLKAEAKKRIFPERIDKLLSNRWFPALNRIGQFVGMDENENKAITDRTGKYIFNGPFRIKGIAE